MQLISDFHIHGPFAQACSRNTTLSLLEENAKLKGLNVLGTGDCLHPKWFDFITKELTEDENGILWSKNKFPFIWQTELSFMYKQDGKGRRIHHVLLFPNKEVVEQVRDAFLKKGRLDYDGRPIFGISSIELVDMLRSISEDIEIIPSHCLTPFFGIFGSMTGFDSVEECFKEKTKYIHAVETGLSADPPMLSRVSKFDKINLVSFSDPHSYHPHRLGREATIFDLKDITYRGLINSIRTGEGLKGTIEVNPNYGKYHFDGHRNCNISFSPKESDKLNKICPVCKQKLTIGVQNRIEQLADRPENYVKKDIKPFYSLMPLSELISIVMKKGLSTKTVTVEYKKVMSNFKNEFDVLLNVGFEDLKKITHEKIADAIIKIREGKVRYKPGYDGVYGKVILDENEIIEQPKPVKALTDQKSLSEF